MSVKKSLLFLAMAVALTSVFIIQHSLAQGKIEKVVVTGMGLSEEMAVQNASKTAIQQVVGMYVVSDTVMENRELIKDQVLSQSNGYIKSFDVLTKSKDEDGLFSIEAAVEVEVGKLTNKLGELNIAVKDVGTEEFVAISLDKFDSSEDFKTMADRVMFQPLRENKKVYNIAIKSFDLIDSYEGVRIEWQDGRNSKKKAALGEIKPFRVVFNIALSNDYVNSITQFLDQASKQTFDFLKNGDTNVYVFKVTPEKESHLGAKTLKTYELTGSNYNIYNALFLEHVNNFQPVLVTSLLGDDKSPIIQTSFYFTFNNGNASISRRSHSAGPPNTLNISKEIFIKESDSERWIKIGTGGRGRVDFFHAITGLDTASGFNSLDYKHPEGFFVNTQDLSFIMFLSEEDVKNVKSLKLEMMWLEYGDVFHHKF